MIAARIHAREDVRDALAFCGLLAIHLLLTTHSTTPKEAMYNTIPETPQEPRQPRPALGMIVAVSLLLGASTATIYAKAGVAARLEVTPGATYTKDWTCSEPYLDSAVYGQSSGPLSAVGLTVTLQGVELTETGETSFEFGRYEHVTAELVPSAGVTVSDWAFGGLIGELGGLLPGAAGVKVSCTGIMPPVVNKETGGTPATAIYVAQDYAPQGQTGQIIVCLLYTSPSPRD